MLKILPPALALSVAFAGVSATAVYSQPKFCPPGLANKNPACMPPGLYKRYVLGEPLPKGVPYELITDLFRYDLDRPDGDWLYYLVDGEVLKIADASFVVLEALGLLGN